MSVDNVLKVAKKFEKLAQEEGENLSRNVDISNDRAKAYKDMKEQIRTVLLSFIGEDEGMFDLLPNIASSAVKEVVEQIMKEKEYTLNWY